MTSPFPLGLDSPGPRLASTLQDGSPLRLTFILGEHLTRGHARYARRDVTGDGVPETWCNLYAQDVAEALGVPLPRNTRANDLCDWLAAQSAVPGNGWETASAHVAQAMADAGGLALACWKNPTPGAPGHIAIVTPRLDPDEPVHIAQAGRVNFLRAPLQAGFGALPVVYYVHP